MHIELLTATNNVMALPAAGDDLVGWADGLATDVRSLAVNVARAVVVMGLATAIYKAKFAIASSVLALAVGALLWWAIGSFNSGQVQDKIDGTVNSSRVHYLEDSSTTGDAPLRWSVPEGRAAA